MLAAALSSAGIHSILEDTAALDWYNIGVIKLHNVTFHQPGSVVSDFLHRNWKLEPATIQL